VMLNHLLEELRLPGGRRVALGGTESTDGVDLPGAPFFSDFHLDDGLPVWRYSVDGYLVEKRILMPHFQNTTVVTYRLLDGAEPLRLRLRPSVHFRSYEAAVDRPLQEPYRLIASNGRFELHANNDALPPLRLMQHGGVYPALVVRPEHHARIAYRIERDRGYAAVGHL